MMLSTRGMTAASTAPKTTTSTTSATGTPKISAFSISLLASSVPIWFRLASPVWARVKPSPLLAETRRCSGATFSRARSVSPASTTATRVERLS